MMHGGMAGLISGSLHGKMWLKGQDKGGYMIKKWGRGGGYSGDGIFTWSASSQPWSRACRETTERTWPSPGPHPRVAEIASLSSSFQVIKLCFTGELLRGTFLQPPPPSAQGHHQLNVCWRGWRIGRAIFTRQCPFAKQNIWFTRVNTGDCTFYMRPPADSASSQPCLRAICLVYH